MAAEPPTTPSANFDTSRLLVDSCVRSGADHFFLAPGSRCTPLTVAVANCARARSIQHVDERGLAFACLGYGRATGRPGVFVCTSGTAVANAYPAVIEASLDHVPMIILTADRPPELRDTGANQTIDQVKIFGGYARWFFDLPVPETTLEDQFWVSTIRHAVQRTVDGPVHLNCMFREPFGVCDAGEYSHQVREPIPIQVDVQCHWRVPTGRTLVIVGGARREDAMAAADLAERVGCPYLADITNGVRGLAYDLQLICDDAPAADVVLHVGGRIVSKRWLRFMETHPPQHYIHLTPFADRLDPAHRITEVVRGPLPAICAGAEIEVRSPDSFRCAWQKASAASLNAANEVIDRDGEITEPAVAQTIARYLPPHSGLLLGNSMPVRDMDMFGFWERERNVVVAANRGASGIDGLIATATGFARGLARPTTAVIGDLAALHDLNSLALVASSPVPIVLIVINNDGGGIFHFLPVASQVSCFEELFATPHGRTFAGAATMFGLDYHQPKSRGEFVERYCAAITQTRSSVLEVRTDRIQNRKLHQAIEDEIRRSAV